MGPQTSEGDQVPHRWKGKGKIRSNSTTDKKGEEVASPGNSEKWKKDGRLLEEPRRGGTKFKKKKDQWGGGWV